MIWNINKAWPGEISAYLFNKYSFVIDNVTACVQEALQSGIFLESLHMETIPYGRKTTHFIRKAIDQWLYITACIKSFGEKSYVRTDMKMFRTFFRQKFVWI